MEKKVYGTFRLGRRGRRGRIRIDERWTRDRRGIRKPTGYEPFQPPAIPDTPPVEDGLSNRSSHAAETTNSPPCHNPVHDTQHEDLDLALYGDEPTPEKSDCEDLSSDEDTEAGRRPNNVLSDLEPNGASPSLGDIHDAACVLPPRVRTQLKKVLCWQNLLALLLLNGTGHLTMEQYTMVQVVLNLFMALRMPTEDQLPASSTIRRTIQPILQQWGFVDSEVRAGVVNANRSGAPRANGAIDAGSFIVVTPSAWSRMDVSFTPTWSILKAAALDVGNMDCEPVFRSIQSVSMVTNRDHILDVVNAIVPTKMDDGVSRAPLLLSDRFPNPVVSLHVSGGPPFPQHAFVGMEVSVSEEGLLLRSVSVRSVLVTPSQEELHSSGSFMRVSTTELLDGDFMTLGSPVFNLWRAGDVCTLLEGPPEPEFLFVLVQQHVRRAGMSQEMELLCIPISKDLRHQSECVIEFGRVTRGIVKGITVGVPQTASRELSLWEASPSLGRLQDGRLFSVDHLLLYSDGFSQYNFKQGSAGGIYALSLNYPVALRRSRERVRVIALTPPGVSTMEGLRAIIDDIVKSSTEGVEVKNADGERMVVYTDIVAYVADYHETGHALDITGQSGKAPCHLFAFLRYEGHPSTASQYAYSTVMHSSDTCYARTRARTEAVRASQISNDDLINIGLNPPEDAAIKNSPLLELSKKLTEASNRTTIPLSTQNKLVVNPQFDPYRFVLVSPDHVLFGVSCNALNFAFSVLPSNACKRQLDSLITQYLRRNGLAKDIEIFNFNTSALYAASISTRFASLLVSPEILKEVLDSCKHRRILAEDTNSPRIAAANCSLENLTKLRDLVTATYWFPCMTVDGLGSVKYFNADGGRAHLRRLELLSEEYVMSLNNICRICPGAREHLDKPNVHRVLELYKHSLPAMGHVRHFTELVFETAHQPLKRAMQRSNFRMSHLQSSKSSIADDWKRRLQCIVNAEDLDQSEEHTWDREVELLKLMFGRSEDVINAVTADPTLKRQAYHTLRSQPLRAALTAKRSTLNNTRWFSEWILSKPCKLDSNETELLATLAIVRRLAEDLLVQEGSKDLNAYSRAGRAKLLRTGRRLPGSKPSGHDLLRRDTVLRAWVEDVNAHVLTHRYEANRDNVTFAYFVVIVFVNFGEAQQAITPSIPQNYAVVRKCQQTAADFLQIDSSSSLQLIALTDSVRRVGIVHACQSDGNFDCINSADTSLECQASVFAGHRFYYYDKDRGYPRMA